MINIFQLTTCNYSEGLILTSFGLFDCRSAFSGRSDLGEVKESPVCSVLCLAHMFICMRLLKLPFDLEISLRNSCVHVCLGAPSIHCSAAHLKPEEVNTVLSEPSLWLSHWNHWKTNRLQGENFKGRGWLKRLFHCKWEDLRTQSEVFAKHIRN